VAAPQTEGLVGGVFVNIATGTDKAPRVPVGGTIPGREPVQISDLLQQASDTVILVHQAVASLHGDFAATVKQVALAAEDVHGLLEEVRPDVKEIARNGSRISADTRDIVAGINRGEGTIGKLIKDDQLYEGFRGIADQAQGVMSNLRQVTDEARGA